MGSRVTELPLAGLELSQGKPRESSQRMGRVVLWVALAILLPAPAILQPLDQENPARGWAGWSCGWRWPSCSLLLQSSNLLTRRIQPEDGPGGPVGGVGHPAPCSCNPPTS